VIYKDNIIADKIIDSVGVEIVEFEK